MLKNNNGSSSSSSSSRHSAPRENIDPALQNIAHSMVIDDYHLPIQSNDEGQVLSVANGLNQILSRAELESTNPEQLEQQIKTLQINNQSILANNQLKAFFRKAHRVVKKLKIDQAVFALHDEALKVVVGVVGVVGVLHDVAAGVVENVPAQPLQIEAAVIPFTQKYPMKQNISDLPVCDLIDQMTQQYYQLYVLRNLNDYTQVWGPSDQNREAAESALLGLQKDAIDYFFTQTAQASATAEGALSFLKDMQALYDNIDGRPVNEIQKIYRIYLEASDAIYRRHALNESLSTHARKAKTLDNDLRKEISDEMAIIGQRIAELNRTKTKLSQEFEAAVVKNTAEMANNVFERACLSGSISALEKTQTIYTRLNQNQTISPHQYEYLRDHEVAPAHQHEKNKRLLSIAKNMIALQPGYDEIDRRAKVYLDNFTAASLRAFIQALRLHINALRPKILGVETDIEKNLPLLKLYMYILKNLVPDLPVIAVQGMIRYDKHDFDLLSILRGEHNAGNTLFAEIAQAYGAQLEDFKNITRDFINKTVGLINDDIATYMTNPSFEVAQRIVKRLGYYHEFTSDYLEISKGERLTHLTEFVIDDFNTTDPKITLNTLLDRFKTGIISHISRIKFGTQNQGLRYFVSCLMHLNQAIEPSQFLEQKTVLRKLFSEITSTAKVKSKSAVQRLGIIPTHKIISGLNEILHFNNLFRSEIARSLNIQWESQESLILKVLERLAVNPGLEQGIIFYEAFIDSLVNAAVNARLAKFYTLILPFPGKVSLKHLDLNELLPVEALEDPSTEIRSAIMMVIDNNPDIESIDFGRFAPPSNFFRTLINDYEKIDAYYFPLDAESNPNPDNINQNATVYLTKARDTRKEKSVYFRSRKSLLVKLPDIKAPVDEMTELVKQDLKNAKSKAVEFKDKSAAKLKTGLNKLMKRNNSELSQESRSDSSSSNGTPSVQSPPLLMMVPEIVVDHFPEFLTALINHGMSPKRLFKVKGSLKTSLADNFHSLMLRAYRELNMSIVFAVEMREVALEDNDGSAYEWLDILSESLADQRPFIKSAYGFFMKLDKATIQASLVPLTKFSDAALNDYAELMPADYTSLITDLLAKIDLTDDNFRLVIITLFKAYLSSRNLLNDYNNVDVVNEHRAFLASLLNCPPLHDQILSILSNEFIFSSIYSSDTLRAKFPNMNVQINTALVSRVIAAFTAHQFSEDAVIFANHMQILMTNQGLCSNNALHAAFIIGLSHYLETYSSDVDFVTQLHLYISHIQTMKIVLNDDQSVALLTPINTMSRSKWRNSQHDLACLVDMLPDGDTVINRALFEALEVYETMARDYQLNRVVSLSRRERIDQEWVFPDDDLPLQLQSLPVVAQDMYRYFMAKLRSEDDQVNLKLGKQTKKLDIIITLLNDYQIVPAPAVDPCITARNALRSLERIPTGNTAINRFVNSLESSGLLGDVGKIVILRDAMKHHLYDVLMKSFVIKYGRALRTKYLVDNGLSEVEADLKDLAKFEALLTAIAAPSRNDSGFGIYLLARLRTRPTHFFTRLASAPRPIDKLLERLTPMLIENITQDTARTLLRPSPANTDGITVADLKEELSIKRNKFVSELGRLSKAIFDSMH